MNIAGFPSLYPAEEAKKKYPQEVKKHGGRTVEPTTAEPTTMP